MMRRRVTAIFLSKLLLLLMLVNYGCAAPAKMAAGDVPRMEVDELNARLGEPNLAVIDVRAGGDWKASTAKIKGAIREAGKNVSDWVMNYSKDKTIILYCA
jgi:hypothetical protein